MRSISIIRSGRSFVILSTKTKPEIVILGEPIKAVGLTVNTSMKSIFRDSAEVLKRFMECKKKYGIPNQKTPWEYVSLSRNFSDDNNTWDYLTGNAVSGVEKIPEVFSEFEVPSGKYAVFHIRPKYKIMLGPAIGKMKKYIYEDWLPKSEYEFAGWEFEYNSEKMYEENPNHIDLYVAVKEKTY